MSATFGTPTLEHPTVATLGAHANQEFRCLRSHVPEEREDWLNAYQAWPDREPHAHPAFAESFLEDGQQAVCFVHVVEGAGALFPLILRPLAADRDLPLDGYFDATTPYGYGGAFYWGNVDSNAFWDEFDAWAKRQQIVTLFARLSLFSTSVLPFRGTTKTNQDNIVRTLDLTDARLLMDYEHKVRKNINKAVRSGVTIEWDLSAKRLEEFHQIYINTMIRCQASNGYFFPLSFFEKLVRECPNELAFVHAFVGERMISTELVLVGTNHTYSFLGGTEQDSFDLRPNDLLKHEIIRWSRDNGKESFVLGGGYGGADGIYRYKHAFAPHDGVVPFFVGQRVYDAQMTEFLTERQRRLEPGWEPAEGFFPPYRAPRVNRK